METTADSDLRHQHVIPPVRVPTQRVADHVAPELGNVCHQNAAVSEANIADDAVQSSRPL
jgi:hypothetical protein